jgi:hypothetical protein
VSAPSLPPIAKPRTAQELRQRVLELLAAMNGAAK